MIIGVDNGIDGGICAISDVDGSLISHTGMPNIERKGKREIDIVGVREWLRDISIKEDDTIVIEEPLKHAKSSQAMRSMGISFGYLCGMVRLMGMEPFCVEVREWQKRTLGRVPKGQTKVAALKIARQLEPEESWFRNDRCRSPHDGIIDAFLIAKDYFNHEHHN